MLLELPEWQFSRFDICDNCLRKIAELPVVYVPKPPKYFSEDLFNDVPMLILGICQTIEEIDDVPFL